LASPKYVPDKKKAQRPRHYFCHSPLVCSTPGAEKLRMGQKICFSPKENISAFSILPLTIQTTPDEKILDTPLLL
jgi:hypothetical protein